MNKWFYFDHWVYNSQTNSFIELNDMLQHSKSHYIKIHNNIQNNMSKLVVEQNTIHYDGIIKDIFEYKEKIIIRLENYPCDNSKDSTYLLNNIYAINMNGSPIWNIKDIIKKHLGLKPDEYYTDMKLNNTKIFRVFTSRCITFDINLDTLEVIQQQ